MKKYQIGGLALVAAAGIGLAPAANAETVFQLSDMSSDSTPASSLTATMGFSLSGNTLTVTITNDSAFVITDFFFNSGGFETSLTLTATSGNFSGTDPWILNGASGADGFGTFDHWINGGNNASDPPVIANGETAVFTFTVSGSPTIYDFTTYLSDPPPNDDLARAIVAAKFQSGPGGDSAFGASSTLVPVPPALAMGLLGLVGVAAGRKRYARKTA